jgi:hypothetical protein
MQRYEARKIAETITFEELKQMFMVAQKSITDWSKQAHVNKSMTKGSAFNLLSNGFGEGGHYTKDTNIHILAKTNMIWEFGEFLPNYIKPKKKAKTIPTMHQEPKFIKP